MQNAGAALNSNNSEEESVQPLSTYFLVFSSNRMEKGEAQREITWKIGPVQTYRVIDELSSPFESLATKPQTTHQTPCLFMPPVGSYICIGSGVSSTPNTGGEPSSEGIWFPPMFVWDLQLDRFPQAAAQIDKWLKN